MEIKKVEKIVEVEQYVAFDGCVFEDKDECRNYETECYDRACEYIEEHCVKSFCGLDVGFLGEAGSDYTAYYVVNVTDIETVANLQTVFLMYIHNETEREKIAEKIDNAYRNGDRVLINCWDDDSWEWNGTYMECLNECARDLTRIFSEKIKREE